VIFNFFKTTAEENEKNGRPNMEITKKKPSKQEKQLENYIPTLLFFHK